MELKPCPFCGGEAYITISSDGYGVECSNQRCIVIQMDQLLSEAEAVRTWNTRAERTCKPKRVPVSFDRELWPGVTEMHRLVCSECGCADLGMSGVNYCPNCGAKVVEA